jgi:hypothetical protein
LPWIGYRDFSVLLLKGLKEDLHERFEAVPRESLAAPPSDHVTFPLGKFPVTAAVQTSPWNTTAEDVHVTVVVVLLSATLVLELVVSAAAGVASIVRDEAKRTRSITIEVIFFDI